jgi:hypothetical protein
MNVVLSEPLWGETLKPGYCGFITRERDIIGDDIEWFERFDKGLPFCHAFVVARQFYTYGINDTVIIEAHARAGVHAAFLSEYLGDPNCQCFIRVPFGYTDEVGAEIVTEAKSHLGEKYDYGLIVADAMANTYMGHLINRLTWNIPDKLVCALFTQRHHAICSELAAEALKSQQYLSLLGCLSRPSDTIMPADLGNDDQVFQETCFKLTA